jgi:uncharacterized membrane protein
MPPAELPWYALIVALALVFVAMGVLHFVPAPARGMSRMIPPRLRGRGLLSPGNLVRFTGLCEIAGGIGLLVPATRGAAAVALAVFLVAVFPANAFAAKHPDTFGRAAIPFWPRLAGQVALIAVLVAIAVYGPR